MNDKIQKLMELKSKSRDMSPLEKKAKMDVLKQLMGTVQGAMGDHLKGLKKVTVAAPDKEGLEAGLDKAKDLMSGEEHDPMAEDSEEDMGEDLESDEEAPEHSMGHEDESDDDIDAQIQALMLKKEMKKKGMGI